MEKLFIQNLNHQKIAVVVENAENGKELVFIAHGQGAFKEQPQVRAIAEAFLQHDFTVVTYDARNTIGESEGKMEDASITSYLEDLESVIVWAKDEGFYKEPFFLAGQSLGGICVGLYSQKHPEKVQGLVLISSVISGKLSYEAHMEFEPEKMKEWEEKGYREDVSNSKPGLVKRLNWANVEDRLKYSLLDEAEKLTMPVLQITGDKDQGNKVEYQQMLLEKLPGKKKLDVLPGAPHTLREEKDLKAMQISIDSWIKEI